MKYTLYIAVLASILLSSTDSFAQKKKIVSIVIESTDFGTQTLVAVGCSQFNKMFAKTINRYKITDNKYLVVFETAAKHFVLPGGAAKIDVRGIITFNYRKSYVKYCFDRYGLFFGKQKYFKNQQLINLIQSYQYSKK